MSREIITRRNLPHWFMPHAMHFLTFLLVGTIPNDVLERFRSRKSALLKTRTEGELAIEHRTRVHKQLFAEYDRYLDAHREIHWLDDPRVAALVRRSLYFWQGQRYQLACWCIMPNHVHVLLQPLNQECPDGGEIQDCGESMDADNPLSTIMHGLKSYTAHAANKLLGRSGQFWQHESYDHWVRDDADLQRIVAYINANPVDAGLCRRPHEFPWCSAHDRYLHDGDESGWLCFDSPP